MTVETKTLEPYQVYPVKPSAEAFPAIYLGEFLNSWKLNKHLLLCRSKSGEAKRYCFDEYNLVNGTIEDVCLREMPFEKIRDDILVDFCRDLLDRRGL